MTKPTLGSDPTDDRSRARTEAALPGTPPRVDGIPFDRAFGIAHVMNNLLAVVAGHLEAIQELPDDPVAARDSAGLALLAAERAARLVRGMMATFSGQAFRPGHSDSLALLQSLAASRHGSSMAAPVLVGGEAVPLMVDTVALTDLLANTIDALEPTAAEGTIRLDSHMLRQPQPGLRPGSYGLISITGGAWRAPIWQQRALGENGHAALHSFCRDAGGIAEIRQLPDGTCVIGLHLPMIKTGTAPRLSKGVAPPRKGQVLIVEDDGQLRQHAERVIASLGYGVLSAESGESALALIEGGATIDVLFTDVVLPEGISGGELAEQVWRIQPAVPIVFTSGHNADSVVAEILGRNGAVMLPKPYRRNTLARTLEAALGRNGMDHVSSADLGPTRDDDRSLTQPAAAQAARGH